MRHHGFYMYDTKVINIHVHVVTTKVSSLLICENAASACNAKDSYSGHFTKEWECNYHVGTILASVHADLN